VPTIDFPSPSVTIRSFSLKRIAKAGHPEGKNIDGQHKAATDEPLSVRANASIGHQKAVAHFIESRGC